MTRPAAEPSKPPATGPTLAPGSGSAFASRVGRRLLLMFLLVALLPVALLGGLAGTALLEANDRMERRAADESLRQAGAQLFDRLVTARDLLQAWPADLSAATLPGLPQVLSAGVRLDEQGQIESQAGDAAEAGQLPADWAAAAATAAGRPVGAGASAAVAPGSAGSATGASGVAVDPVTVRVLPAAGEGPARVLLAREDAAGRPRWIARLAAQRLWEGLDNNAAWAVWTVSDAQGRVLYRAHPGRLTIEPGWRDAHYDLFLRGEFGAADWSLRLQHPEQRPAILGLDWRGWLVLAAVGVLAVVALMSLVQIRRTLDPLRALTEGTRRLAGGDTSVRIPCVGADEFADLSRGFNHMAGRIDEQLRALHMLAAIDRDILRRAPPEEVATRILAQFVASHEGARALVAWIEEDGLPVLHGLHCSSPHPEPVALPPQPLGADLHRAFRALKSDIAMRRDTVPDELAPPWVTPLLDPSVRQLAIYCVPYAAALSAEAQQRGSDVAARRNRAVLCIGLPRERTAALRPVLREAEELRDRLAVAYAARERDDLLLYRAMHDSLTGLTNRQGLNEFLDALLLAEPATPRAVLFIDLDRFKLINDTLGHAAGDELLCDAAGRLVALAPAGAVVARPGGDEFVVLLPRADERGATDMAQAVCDRLAEPFVLRGTDHVLGASVGVALAPAHGSHREDLLRHADMAMYAAKRDGRGRWRVYSPPMDVAARERLERAAELRQAIEHGQLVPYFQPRVGALDGVMRSAEALVRWQHPTRGLMMPGAFIELAEESDLIEGIGEIVLDASCAQMARWSRERSSLTRVSVNVSPRQLQSGRLLDLVRGSLDRHGLAPQALELEITESLLVEDGRGAIEQLAELRRWGVTIALDDFGTGYSSMATLRTLPIDVMKVDRAFVKDLGRDSGALAITRAIITLARTLGHHVVAEGVETEEQAALLRELGCDELQGYLFGKPVAAADLPTAPA